MVTTEYGSQVASKPFLCTMLAICLLTTVHVAARAATPGAPDVGIPLALNPRLLPEVVAPNESTGANPIQLDPQLVVPGDLIICESGVMPGNSGCIGDLISDLIRFGNGKIQGVTVSTFQFFSDPFDQNGVDAGSVKIPDGGLLANRIYIPETLVGVGLGVRANGSTIFGRAVLYSAADANGITNTYKIVSDDDPVLTTNQATGPRMGDKDPLITYDAVTQTLKFSGGTIDFVNAAGGVFLDPAYSNDPVLGAMLEITDFTLSGPSGTGFLFTGGTISIVKGAQTFFSAMIPELLVDDSGLSGFGMNLYGLLDIPIDQILNDSGSSFVDQYDDFSGLSALPAELLGTTAIPIVDFIRNGQSFSTAINGLSVGYSLELPEPSSLALFVIGLLGLALIGRRRTICMNGRAMPADVIAFVRPRISATSRHHQTFSIHRLFSIWIVGLGLWNLPAHAFMPDCSGPLDPKALDVWFCYQFKVSQIRQTSKIIEDKINKAIDDLESNASPDPDQTQFIDEEKEKLNAQRERLKQNEQESIDLAYLQLTGRVPGLPPPTPGSEPGDDDLITYFFPACNGQFPVAPFGGGVSCELTVIFVDAATGLQIQDALVASVFYEVNLDPDTPDIFVALGTSSDFLSGFELPYTVAGYEPVVSATLFDASGNPIVFTGVEGQTESSGVLVFINAAEPDSLALLCLGLLLSGLVRAHKHRRPLQ